MTRTITRLGAAALLALLALSAADADGSPAFDVDVTLVNDFDKSFTGLPRNTTTQKVKP